MNEGIEIKKARLLLLDKTVTHGSSYEVTHEFIELMQEMWGMTYPEATRHMAQVRKTNHKTKYKIK